MDWHYEKLGEDYNVETVSQYTCDTDGRITGHIVINVKAWFDENPAEARRLGWTKHITHNDKEIEAICPYNKQTQVLVISAQRIDDFTIEDTYHVMDKSEEMLRLEELMAAIGYGDSNGFLFTV